MGGPDELAVSPSWEPSGTGLRGTVVVENVGSRTCRIGVKPGVRPLGRDGSPLPLDMIVTLELRHPSHVVLQPGARASAPVSWRSWCGAPAGDRAIVHWDGGETVVTVEGPRQPECTSPAPANLSSSWFTSLG
ncbi:DUF4232 domain-containing protein [Amycolatopsis sp. NPDC049253]|uniref:DUF4232 domain-containing protein n=1 Tax=Amycolatopsis sp. NPDC049253 TaxID=3155274 RepID=UPI00342E8220